MIRRLLKTKAGKVSRFVVTFDAYGVVDTIERDGKLIASNTPDAQKILRHADALFGGLIAEKLYAAGFTYDKGR